MKRFLIIILSIAALALTSCAVSETSSTEPVDYVSTLVGTLSKHSFSTGNTYPAVARPWGMNFWTPQTGRSGDGWAYVYTDDKIRGIKQTHQPSPWINDYGQFAIMPVTTGPVFNEFQRASWFSHKAETAKPYFYSVYLADHDTFVELTPTERAAAFRITYPEKDTSYFVVDPFDKGSYVSIEGNRIIGYTSKNSGGVTEDFKNWFVIESDTPFTYAAVYKDGEQVDGTQIECDHAGALVGFKTVRGQQVNLKVASSFISLEQAQTNLKELDGKDFDQLVAEGRKCWNETLGRIKVQDDNIDHLRTFYSCLYRSVLFPRDLSEIDANGKRVHYSPYDGQIHEGYLFGDTGFWDTFRSLFALVNLVYPDQASKIQEGFTNVYLESGFLPEWSSPGHRGCMVGNNSASVVAEAYLKGIRGQNIDALWEAVKHGANAVHPTVKSTGRYGWELYNELGYVPCDIGINESAARTLEYAYDDWCIYQLGKALGKSEDELAQYKHNALNYKNLYSAEDHLMRGRKANGDFRENFMPTTWGGDFTEGNSLHYTWSVFHDIAGLKDLMGGDEAFAKNLDFIFEMPPIFDESYYGSVIHEIREMQVMNMGNYAHGNQPIQHVLYLYDWCKQPWKAQSHIREAMEKLYTSAPDGYCGDEDNGQTSAWYIFSALGFYPVCPSSDQYALGTPLFKKVDVSLPNGKTFSIEAPKNSSEAFYVNAMKVNGRNYTRNYVTHSDLLNGAKIKVDMSAEPNYSRGTAQSDEPYSFKYELSE